MLPIFYLNTWESNKVGSNTETGTRAGLCTHRWDVGVKDRESGSSGECNESDFVKVERAFWDGVGGQSDHKTLNEVFYSALKKFSEVKHISDHCLYNNELEKKYT